MVAPRRALINRWRAFVSSIPFLLFALQSLLATFYSLHPTYSTSVSLRAIFRPLLAFFAVFAGGAHFSPGMYAFYASMVFLPLKAFWVYASGAVFALAGACLLVDRWQHAAAKVIALALIGVFPANVACVVMRAPREEVFGGSRAAAILRLPFQASFICWALWFSEPMVAV